MADNPTLSNFDLAQWIASCFILFQPPKDEKDEENEKVKPKPNKTKIEVTSVEVRWIPNKKKGDTNV